MESIYESINSSWMTINVFCACWALSHAIRHLHVHVPNDVAWFHFDALPEDKKRNVVTYITQFVVTTFILVAQICGGYDVVFKFSDVAETTEEQVNWMNVAAVTLCILYIWELIYRVTIGYPLLLHHLITILLVQLVLGTFFDTQQIIYLRIAMILGFHASTEQLTFVALYVYRVGLLPSYHSMLFYVSALQTGLVKAGLTIFVLYLYGVEVRKGTLFIGSWGTFWKYMLPPLVILLFITQVYACKILFILSEKTKYDENGSSHGDRVFIRSSHSIWNMGTSEDDKKSPSSLWSLRTNIPVEIGNVENTHGDDSSILDHRQTKEPAEMDEEELTEIISSDRDYRL